MPVPPLPSQYPQQLYHVTLVPLPPRELGYIPANAVGSEAHQGLRARDSVVNANLQTVRTDLESLSREVASMRTEIEAVVSSRPRRAESSDLDSTSGLTDLSLESWNPQSVDVFTDSETPLECRTNWPWCSRVPRHLHDYYRRIGRAGAAAPRANMRSAPENQHNNDHGNGESQNGNPRHAQLQWELQTHNNSLAASMDNLFRGIEDLRAVVERMRDAEEVPRSGCRATFLARLLLGLNSINRDLFEASCHAQIIYGALSREGLVVHREDNEITRDGEHANPTMNREPTTGVSAGDGLPQGSEQNGDGDVAPPGTVFPQKSG
jgi:hypothetical protein